MSTNKELAREVARRIVGALEATMDSFQEKCFEEQVLIVARYGAQQRVEGRDELILRHRCSCEVCAHSSELCPASASSIAMERTSSERIAVLEREAESLGATSAAKDGEK